MDTVSQLFTVDGGLPAGIQKNGDSLTVIAGSAKAKVQKQTGPVKGSGTVFVIYDRTTGNESRVDFAGTEKIKTIK